MREETSSVEFSLFPPFKDGDRYSLKQTSVPTSHQIPYAQPIGVESTDCVKSANVFRVAPDDSVKASSDRNIFAFQLKALSLPSPQKQFLLTALTHTTIHINSQLLPLNPPQCTLNPMSTQRPRRLSTQPTAILTSRRNQRTSNFHPHLQCIANGAT